MDDQQLPAVDLILKFASPSVATELSEHVLEKYIYIHKYRCSNTRPYMYVSAMQCHDMYTSVSSRDVFDMFQYMFSACSLTCYMFKMLQCVHKCCSSTCICLQLFGHVLEIEVFICAVFYLCFR